MRAMVASVAMFFCLQSPSQAGVIWTVSQSGSDTIATASGSFLNSYYSSSVRNFLGPQYVADGLAMFALDVPQNAFYNNAPDYHGTGFGFNWLRDPDSGSGAFGYVGSELLWGDYLLEYDPVAQKSGLLAGTEVSATLKWSDATVNEVLGAGLWETPRILWYRKDGVNENTISLVRATTVPEPSTLSLIFISAGLFLSSRRRVARKLR